RFENKNISALPAALEEQAKLSRWLDYKEVEHFLKEYEAPRKIIHALYERYVKDQNNKMPASHFANSCSIRNVPTIPPRITKITSPRITLTKILSLFVERCGVSKCSR